jgi:hypothetical protein
MTRARLKEASHISFFATSVGSAGIGWAFSRTELAFFNMIIEAQRLFQKAFFMEIVIMAAWHIWKQRNSKKNRTKLLVWQIGRQDLEKNANFRCIVSETRTRLLFLWIDTLD